MADLCIQCEKSLESYLPRLYPPLWPPLWPPINPEARAAAERRAVALPRATFARRDHFSSSQPQSREAAAAYSEQLRSATTTSPADFQLSLLDQRLALAQWQSSHEQLAH